MGNTLRLAEDTAYNVPTGCRAGCLGQKVTSEGETGKKTREIKRPALKKF